MGQRYPRMQPTVSYLRMPPSLEIKPNTVPRNRNQTEVVQSILLLSAPCAIGYTCKDIHALHVPQPVVYEQLSSPLTAVIIPRGQPAW